jgi:4-amino-4-deoxy-L-arabinose transferase-like glycosyltransferase
MQPVRSRARREASALRTRRFWLLCAGILVLEAAAVLGLSAEGRHQILGGDGPEYDRYARNLVRHGAYSDALASPYDPSVFRTPGYPLFLAGLRLVGDGSLLVVRCAQFLLVGAIAWLVFLLGRTVADETVGRVAALLSIVYLPFLWLARMHLTEVLATTLATAVVVLLVRGARRVPGPRPGYYALVGVATGVLALVRPAFALVAVPIALGLIVWPGAGVPRRTGLVRAAVVVVAVLVPLAPWTARNHSVADRFIPLGANGGAPLFISAHQWKGSLSLKFTARDWDRYRQLAAPHVGAGSSRPGGSGSVAAGTQAEIDTDRRLRAAARRTAGEISATDVIRRLPARAAYLWAVADFPPSASATAWHRLAQLQYFLLVAFAGLGILAAIRRGLRPAVLWPLLLFPLYLTLVHLVFNVEARFTIPARPSLLVFAALGVTYLWARLGPGESAPRAPGTSRGSPS